MARNGTNGSSSSKFMQFDDTLEAGNDGAFNVPTTRRYPQKESDDNMEVSPSGHAVIRASGSSTASSAPASTIDKEDSDDARAAAQRQEQLDKSLRTNPEMKQKARHAGLQEEHPKEWGGVTFKKYQKLFNFFRPGSANTDQQKERAASGDSSSL